MTTYTITDRDGEHRTITLSPSRAKGLDYLIDAGKEGTTTEHMTPGYRFSDALHSLRHEYGVEVDSLRNADPDEPLWTYVLRSTVVRGHRPNGGAA